MDEITADCTYKVDVELLAQGYNLAECVEPNQANGHFITNLAERGIAFTGFLSSYIDTDTCRVVVSGMRPWIYIKTDQTENACGPITDSYPTNTIVLSTGLTWYDDPFECSGILQHDLKIWGGSPKPCDPYGTGGYADKLNYVTNWSKLSFIGMGVKRLDDCRLQISGLDNRLRVYQSGTCGGSTQPGESVVGLVVGTGLQVYFDTSNDDTCSGVIGLDLKAQGHYNHNACQQPAYGLEKTVTKFRFGSGLTTGLDNCEVTVNAIPFKVANAPDHVCTTNETPQTITGIQFGSGLHVDINNCGATVWDGKKIYGTDRRFGTTSTVTASGFRDIEVIGENLSIHGDGCSAVISGITQSAVIGVTGSNSPCTWSKDIDKSTVAGFVFGTGLETTLDPTRTDLIHVNSRFYTSGNGGVCGGTYMNTAHTTGIVYGLGLKATSSSCQTNVELNFRAASSGSCPTSTVGTKNQIGGLIFGRGLEYSLLNSCTGFINSSFKTQGGPDNACGPAAYGNEKFTNLIKFGEGFNTGFDSSSCTLTVESPAYKLRGLNECGAATVATYGSTGIAFGSGLELIQSGGGCAGVVRTNFTAIGTDARAGGGGGVNKRYTELEFVADRLSVHTDGCRVLVSGKPGGGSITLSGIGSCGESTDYLKEEGVSTLKVGQGLLATAGGNIESVFNITGIIDNGCGTNFATQNITGIKVGDGLELANGDTDECNVILRSNIRAYSSGDLCTSDGTIETNIGVFGFGTGLSFYKDGCTGIINSTFRAFDSGTCSTDGINGTKSHIGGLAIATGLTFTTDGCTGILNLNLRAFDSGSCGVGPGSKSHIDGFAFGSGLSFIADGCTGLIQSTLSIQTTGNSCHATSNPIQFENIYFSGIEMDTERACNPVLLHRQRIQHDGSCNSSTLAETDFEKLIFSTGMKVIMNGCNATIAGGIEIAGDGACVQNITSSFANMGYLHIGRGMNVTEKPDCTYKIDAGLSGWRSGNLIRGQSYNCNTGALNFPTLFPACTDCLVDGIYGPYSNRGVAKQICGIWTGPGIGLTTCASAEDGIVLFSNQMVTGFASNSCSNGDLGVQIYSNHYSNCFTVGSNNGGIDGPTHSTVQGAFTHGNQVKINDRGGAWTADVVTGIDVVTNGDGYVTSVTPKFGTFQGTKSCTAGDATSLGLPSQTQKFWIEVLP